MIIAVGLFDFRLTTEDGSPKAQRRGHVMHVVWGGKGHCICILLVKGRIEGHVMSSIWKTRNGKVFKACLHEKSFLLEVKT
ncbi:hypothetical protein HanPSC8_Chr03g0117381 [Helianthus annuus]|nr:hypothetical protein HanPSC8_Chr03g0117381 [Helianthus annuus]